MSKKNYGIEGQNFKIIYCEDGPDLQKIVTDSFLIYQKTSVTKKKAEVITIQEIETEG